MKLVRHVIGVEGPEAIEKVLDWFAHVIAQPGVKPGWHMIFQGGQGIGKDLLLKPIEYGVGSDNFRPVNPIELSGTFNGWAEKRFCVIDEIRSNSQGTQTAHDQYNALKRLTENTTTRLRINNKYAKEYSALNVCAFFITANDQKAVALEPDYCRFMVIMAGKKVTPWSRQDYADLADWLAKKGAMLCAEWLWQRYEAMDAVRRADILARPPMTDGKRQMIQNAESPIVAWLRDQIEHAWPDVMTATDIQAAITAAGRAGALPAGLLPQTWSIPLKGLGAEQVYRGNVMRLKGGGVSRVWAVRNPELYKDADIASLHAALDMKAHGPGKIAADFTGEIDKVVSITRTKTPVSDVSDISASDTGTDTAAAPAHIRDF